MGDTSGTANNDWIDLYLEASLTTGLSSEYSHQAGRDRGAKPKDNPFAAMYANKILKFTADEISYQWHKATSTPHANELDVRREQLSWRMWGVHYRKQRVAYLNAKDSSWQKALAESQGPILPEPHEHSHDDYDDTTSGDDDMMTPTPGSERRSPFGNMPALQEGSEPREGVSPRTAAEATDSVTPLPGAPSLRLRSRKSLEFKRSESLLLGQMAPINAEDRHASGDLDAGRGLRVDTARAPSRGLAEALVDPNVPLSPESDHPKDPFANRKEGLYICLISLHGLVRGDKMELGKDADTGGQVKYVVELCRALSLHPAVHRVELLTRLITDPKVADDYGQPEECIRKGDPEYELGGAYIVRLPCGDPNVYLRKEKLWAHTREFADAAIQHCTNTLRRLQRAGEPCELYTVHGHYADAGEVASMVASTMASTETGLDMVMTGHSLGRNKLEHLLATGTMTKRDIESTYKIERRIEGEERGLDYSTMVFTSTQQEINEQWGLYDGYNVRDAKALRPAAWRQHNGRLMPIMNVIPPGLDFSNLKVDLPEDPNLKGFHGSKPQFVSRKSQQRRTSTDAEAKKEEVVEAGLAPPSPEATHDSATGSDAGTPRSDGGRGLLGKSLEGQRSNLAHHMFEIREGQKLEKRPIWQEINRFLNTWKRPAILAMSRPDAKKNITTLVQAFGENPELRKWANLVLVMGNRQDIKGLASGSQKVLNEVLYLIDKHDLYGYVAYPKAHAQSDISDIYSYARYTHGIFVNPALQEPFGLTVIEAAAHGVPTVATQNGGPVDIMKTLHHGVTVDPTNSKQLGDELLKILTNHSAWETMSKNGVKNIHAYSWLAHSRKYLEAMASEKAANAAHKRRQSPGRAQSLDLSLPTGHMGSGRRSIEDTARPSGDKADAPAQPEAHVAEEVLNADSDVRGKGRDAFIVVPVDGLHRASAAAAALKQAQKTRGVADGNVGLGIIAMDAFDDVAAWLKEASFDMCEVDWVVANSGADIRHLSSDGASWLDDDKWEEHIDWRWVCKAMGKTLGRVPIEERSASKRHMLLTNINSADGSKKDYIHQYHLLMGVAEDAQATLDSLAKNGRGLPPTVIMDRLKNNLRKLGYRCQVTLQLVPGPTGWISKAALQPRFHVTPLRASRGLALRFLGHRFGVSLDRFVVLLPAPAVTVNDEEAKIWVCSHCSDLTELVGGQPRIAVEIPAKPDPTADADTLSGTDQMAVQRMRVKLSKKLYNERVAWGPAGDDSTLQSILTGLPPVSDGKDI